MPYKNLVITNSQDPNQNTTQFAQFYKGFSTVNNNQSNVRLYDFELIQRDIINQFSTRKGERVMNPNFGSIIWDLIMEPLTEEVSESLMEDIQIICNSDPRVTPTQIDLNEYDNGYILELTLLLKGTDQSAQMKLTFDSNIGLSASQ
jgi:phage baseplate assembly protein W